MGRRTSRASRAAPHSRSQGRPPPAAAVFHEGEDEEDGEGGAAAEERRSAEEREGDVGEEGSTCRGRYAGRGGGDRLGMGGGGGADEEGGGSSESPAEGSAASASADQRGAALPISTAPAPSDAAHEGGAAEERNIG